MKVLKKTPRILIALIAFYFISGIVNPNMFSSGQLTNLMKTTPFLAVVAMGHTFVVLSGGTDLSVSSVITATLIISCRIMDYGNGSIFLAVAACLVMGVVVGVVKGFIITRFNILPLVVTLSLNYVIFGLALILSKGVTIGRVSPEFEVITKGYTFGVIPNSFIIMIIVGVVFWFILNKTRFGNELYCTGANARAAYVSGINESATIIKAHIVCSISAVITGLLLASYIQIPSFDAGDPYSLNSLAAVLVGGSAMTGGVGSVVLSMLGAMFVTMLNSFLNVIRSSIGVQYLCQGAIIVFGVWISSGRIDLGGIKANFRARRKNNTSDIG